MTDSLARGLDQLHQLLTSVSSDDLSRPTPCSDWSVADLADHAVNSVSGMATMARGGEPDWSASTHHDDAASAFRAAGDDLLSAVSDAGAAFPHGMAVAELAVHSFDLVTGLGRPTTDLDAGLAEEGLTFMQDSLTDDARGGAFGPEQPAPGDADAYQRLAAFAGRSI